MHLAENEQNRMIGPMSNTKKTEKLWQKAGMDGHQQVNEYCVGDEMRDDAVLLPYDVQGSMAHAKMLAAQGLLSDADAKKLLDGLQDILDLHAKGAFRMDPANEDMHTEIELYLVDKLGDIGKRIHVGRSRNDQVLTALRLYSKEQLSNTDMLVRDTARTILDFAKAHEFVPMPGYTHMQHAMPSSVGQWAGDVVESLINDRIALKAALDLNDQNPLGSGAGFGSGVNLDRQKTTKDLGFSRLQRNPIYCQNSRGKIESMTIGALSQVMMTLGRLANDLVVFYSQEFGYFKIDPSMTTGSSMMPQKRNLDIMEVLRGNVSVVLANQQQCQSAGLNLISGYNKDMKVTKRPLLESFDITQDSLRIVMLLFGRIKPDEERLRAVFKNKELFATDAANALVAEGMSFRDAYKQVGENLDALAEHDLDANIRGKTHDGATGNLGLDDYAKLLKD